MEKGMVIMERELKEINGFRRYKGTKDSFGSSVYTACDKFINTVFKVISDNCDLFTFVCEVATSELSGDYEILIEGTDGKHHVIYGLCHLNFINVCDALTSSAKYKIKGIGFKGEKLDLCECYGNIYTATVYVMNSFITLKTTIFRIISFFKKYIDFIRNTPSTQLYMCITMVKYTLYLNTCGMATTDSALGLKVLSLWAVETGQRKVKIEYHDNIYAYGTIKTMPERVFRAVCTADNFGLSYNHIEGYTLYKDKMEEFITKAGDAFVFGPYNEVDEYARCTQGRHYKVVEVDINKDDGKLTYGKIFDETAKMVGRM